MSGSKGERGQSSLPPPASESSSVFGVGRISPFGFDDDRVFLQHILANVGVAGVPGSSFLHPPEAGRHLIRFMFAKKEETLHEAGRRLLKLKKSS